MIKLSNSIYIKIVTKLLILLVVAKVISLGIWWYLPSDTIELSVKSNYQPKYQRIDFKNMIKKPVVVVKAKKEEVKTGISITNMILKGLYGTSKKGFVIVAMKSSSKKTTIVGISEDYQGYTLKSITAYSAIFNKAGKDYILELEKSKNDKAITKVRKKSSKKSKSSDVAEESRAVTRKDIRHFAKNPKEIWKNISITPLKDGKKIKGFKVTRISAKSIFATLGLEKNDIIIKANNVVLKSYRDALELYKNINKLDTIQIVVLRDNQEKELVYEIN